tara:strand:- start:14 stop:244 length:231 start_codon:yes stop_codon:yes gene_type:complete
MKKGPFKMGGMSFKGESPVKNTSEAKKRKSLETYNKNLDTKAEELYVSDRAFRTGGTWDTTDEKTKIKYRAKAQNA